MTNRNRVDLLTALLTDLIEPVRESVDHLPISGDESGGALFQAASQQGGDATPLHSTIS